MDRAPLPPHERPWRHPSELGPPEHEPTTTSGRVLIVTTATLGLLLVGVLAISMTPERASPESAASTISGLRTVAPAAAALEAPPLVTPLGDDGWAVTTMSAIAGRSGRRIEARLPSGDIVDVEVVGSDRAAGLTVVSLPEGSDGYELASTDPAPSDTVLVHTDPPRVVTMIELAALDVDEATPVLDEAGDLLGLCTHEDDGVALRTVVTMPADRATTSTARQPATSTTNPPAATATTATTSPTTVPSTTTSTSQVTTGSGPARQVTDGGDATTAPG